MAAASRGFKANTAAPIASYAVPPRSRVGGKGTAKYPVNTQARAKNAISRVQAHGSASEKRMVYAKVRARYPALAKRSTVVPTRTGTGRRYGQPAGATNRRNKR
jgi:hypothetical protein